MQSESILQHIEHITDEAAMLALGEKMAAALPPKITQPLLFFLHGELGVGKTTFTRGFLRGCGYSGHVKSPTYTLLESYHLPHYSIFHLDLYRIHDPQELDYIGIQDCFTENAVIFIEWAEKANNNILPPPDLVCYIDFNKDNVNQRFVKWIAKTPAGKIILKNIIKNRGK